MKTKLTFSEKRAWAKKAALLDIDAEDGYEKFYKIAKESGLGERRLTYYSNAYEAAGESGIKVLSYKKKMPDEIRKDAMDKINEYLYNRVPFNLRKEIGFLVKAQYNRIIVLEKRPLFGDSLQACCTEVFQARYTDFDNRWHLYWMRKFNKWWPYVPKKVIYTVKDCIREVDEDGWGCFWG